MKVLLTFVAILAVTAGFYIPAQMPDHALIASSPHPSPHVIYAANELFKRGMVAVAPVPEPMPNYIQDPTNMYKHGDSGAYAIPNIFDARSLYKNGVHPAPRVAYSGYSSAHFLRVFGVPSPFGGPHLYQGGVNDGLQGNNNNHFIQQPFQSGDFKF